jgi:hypothetical protein
MASGGPLWRKRAVWGLYLVTAVALLLSVAAAGFDLKPRVTCRGTRGESDFLDNPDAYSCDISTYEVAIYVTAFALVVASVITFAVVGLRHRSRTRGTRARADAP